MRAARPSRLARAAAALLVCALAAAALADRETAQFHAGRADKSLAGKKWDEAAALYRKSLDEDATFLPARYGLAQALVGAGNSGAALEELRGFVDAARALDPLPPEWKPVLAKAEKQLGELDAAGSSLQKLLDGYCDEVAALAEKWVTKDPAFAERAVRRALKVRPAHPKCLQVLEKLGKSGAGEVIRLFDGKSLEGWEFANPPTWQVLDGELVGEIRDAAVQIRSVRTFDGDYDVRMEARQIEEYPGPSMFTLSPGWKKDLDCYSFGLLGRDILWTEKRGSGNDRDVVSTPWDKLKTKFDPARWNRWELRFRGKKVTALVNDEVVGEEPLPETRQGGGFVGIVVQDIKAAFRNIEVEKR